MKMTLQAQVGDVISSPEFMSGVASVDNPVILVGSSKGAGLKKQIDRRDPSRGRSNFIVEDAFWWQPKHNSPRAWRVRARRLDPDNSYNPDAERIVFHQKPEGPHPFVIEQVDIHGRIDLFKMEGEVRSVGGVQVSTIRDQRAKRGSTNG